MTLVKSMAAYLVVALVACGAQRSRDSDEVVQVGAVRLAEMQVSGEYSNSGDAVFFARLLEPRPWCGVTEYTFGECSGIAYGAPPSCEGMCDRSGFCGWNDDCTEGVCYYPSTLDAGEITIRGATHQPLVLFATDWEMTNYSCDVENINWWDGGDLLRVTATGSIFPQFSTEVTAPAVLSMLTDASGWTPATFDGSADLILEWDASEPADSIEIIVSGPATGLVSSVTCVTEDDGRFDVPSEALEALGSDGRFAVTVSRVSRTVVNENQENEVDVSARTTIPFGSVN